MKNGRLICARKVAMVAVLAVGLSVPPARAAGSTVYVDVNATGANNGASWPDAYTSLVAGVNDPNFTNLPPNTVMVAGGTYTEQVVLSRSQCGTAIATNLIVAKASEVPILDGGSVRSYGLILSNASYLAIQGFDIRRTTRAGIEAWTYAPGTNVTIQQCLIHDNGYAAIELGYHGNYVKLSMNHCTLCGNAYGILASQYNAGNIAASNTIIANNGKYGISGDSAHSTQAFANNDCFGNGQNYTNITAVAFMSANPSFADPHSGDLRLYADSPCLHAGSDGRDLGYTNANVALPSVETYYVRKDGNDGNAGTANTVGGAFATIQHAADVVTPGDTVYVQAGSYTEAVTLARSGSVSNKITFAANGAVDIKGVQNGIKLDTVTGVRMQGIAVHNALTNGLYLYKSFDNFVADGDVYSNGVNGVMFEAANANVLRNTHVHGNGDEGVVLAAWSGGDLIDRCTVDHNTKTGDKHGFGVGMTNNAQYCNFITIRQCLLLNNNFGVYFPYNAGAGGPAGQDGATGWLVESSDLYGSASGGVWVSSYPYGDMSVRNSIVVGNTGSGGLYSGGSGAFFCDHNNVWGNTPTNYNTSANVPPGTGSISADPTFVDGGAGNFQLQSGSPCVDVGATQTWMTGSVDLAGYSRVYGTNVDLGAYEQQPPVGTLQFSAAAYTVTEDVVQASITVTRTGGTNGAVSVSYATSNGTAMAGSDYTATNGTLSWADGDSADKTIGVPITDDAITEVNETVYLSLSGPTGGASLGSASNAVLTIVDNDAGLAGTLQFSAATYSVTEDVGQVAITVTRLSGSNGAVSVSYATSDGTATAGSDYTATNGILTWADGDTVAKTFSVPIADDTLVESNETVTLSLSGPTGGASLLSPSNAVLTIVDNDAYGTLQFSAAAYSVTENVASVTLTATRTGGSNGVVGVGFATSDGTATAGSDYTATNGALSWGDGDTNNKTFTVPILDDALAESNETVNLALSAPTGGAGLGAPSNAVLTIIDNDSATSGHTIYVDVYAAGLNNGTSWTDAYTSIVAGVNDPLFTGLPPNTVMVAGGTYTEQVVLGPSQSGTAGNTNLIVAKAGDVPIIDGGNVRSYGLILSNASYLAIQGFDIRGTTRAGIETWTYAPGTNVTIRQCLIHDNGYAAIELGYHGGYVNLAMNHCTLCGNAYGILASQYGAGNIIGNNNIIANNGKYGISGDSAHSTQTFANNDCFGNGSNYVNITATAFLSANPSFADPHSGDLRLYTDSPCIHAGTDGQDLGYTNTNVALSSVETYYVRKDGNDSSAGTANTAGGAFATIQHAASLVTPGDTVNVQAGSYTEAVTLARSGSVSNRITFAANGAVDIKGVANGIKLDTVTGVQIQGLVVHNALTNGLYFYKSFDNVFANGDVYSNGVNGVMFEAANANILRTAHVHDNGDEGVVLTAWSGGDFIDRCTLDRNTRTGDAHGFGIGTASGQYCNFILIRQCLLLNNNFGIYFPYQAGNGGLPGQDNTVGWLAENCVIYSNAAGGVWVNGYPYGDLSLRSSIVAGNTVNGGLYAGGAGSFFCDRNDVWGNTPTNYNTTNTVPPDVGSISTDPLFKDAASTNFQLQGGSLCMDAGTNESWMTGAVDLAGNPRVSGASVDMGAYERQPPVGSIFLFR